MKILFLTVALLSFSYSVSAQEAKKENTKTEKKAKEKKAITFTSELIERPAVKYDSQELFVFEFKNTGKTPILIQNVQTSCGCTTANKPEAPIQPGKKGQISVKYDTKRVGDFTKTITVTTNVQTEPIVLTIRGKVLPQEQQEAPKTNN